MDKPKLPKSKQKRSPSKTRTTENNTVLLLEKQPNSMHKNSPLYRGWREEQQQEIFQVVVLADKT